jgi:predicted Zn-dependent peptidase
VTTLEIPSLGEKRYHAEAETNPQVDILWRTVGFAHKDSYALDVVQQLLLGRTGRLHKGLVLGAQVATDVSAEQDSRKWAGFFEISVEVKDGHTPDEVEKAIEREVDGLKNEEVPVEELQKVKNNFAAAEYRKLSANTPILFQLIFNEGLGDWREVNTAGAKIQAVTAADVKRVMGRYFTKENRAVAIYTRKAGTGASAVDDPEMAGLSPEQKPVARQISAAIAAEKDAAGLKAQLSKIEAALGAADPKKQPLQRFMIRKITARLADLEKR